MTLTLATPQPAAYEKQTQDLPARPYTPFKSSLTDDMK